MSTSEPLSTGILDGVRVVDLSSWLAGPVATQFLAEAGADVVKVEPPTGDPTRSWPGFATWNRSKRSVVLDLSTPADQEELHRLIASADVLVHGFAPSVAAGLGIDDAALVERYPQLVVCSILGYPPGHAKVEDPGWELLVMASLGALDEIPGWRPGPIFVRVPLASWHAAYLGATGIVGRLLLRQRTGRGGPAHTSLMQGALQQLSMIWNDAERPVANLTSHRNDPPLVAYLCRDGEWIQITNFHARSDIATILEVVETRRHLGMEDQPMDTDVLSAVLLQRDSTEWIKILRAADVPVEPAADYGELLMHPQAEINGLVVEVDDPQWGRVRQPGPPFHLVPPAGVKHAAPRLGEHTEEVLAETAAAQTAAAEAPAATDETAGDEGVQARTLPLSHVRLLDFGQYLAGPFAPALLSDLGADVIKVEPVTGDRMRGLGAYFQSCQRGKRSLALDLTHPRAREVLDPLLRWCNAVHHNVRRGASARLGIDDEGIWKVNPDVVCSFTNAYGPAGPAAEWPGFDPPFEALAGWSKLIAGEGNTPMYNRFAVLDQHCALGSMLATVLMLYERDVHGHAATARASLLGGAVLTQSETMYLLDQDRFLPVVQLDREQTGVSPGYRIYPATDGWIAVAAVGDEALRTLVTAMDVESADGLASRFETSSLDEAVTTLRQAGVPCEPVKIDQRLAFLEDPTNADLRLTATYEHAEFGKISQVGEVWSLVDRPLKLDRSAPLIGQHTQEILADLGFSGHEIASLAADGVVAGPNL